MIIPPEARYGGAPWRSRFLRAPKAVFALMGDPRFVPLGQLVIARLGAKTGCDKFFFVERIPEGDGGTLLSVSRGAVTVRGLDGWTGRIAKKDLRTAVLNPHRLWSEDGRRLVIPADGDQFFIYPEDPRARGDLRQYVAFAEIHGIHRRPLVASNGSPEQWYRQARIPPSSPWALPYNSAYDYGAWDNSAGAVLNGRFVGVEPLSGTDSDLLGAVLNSTTTAAARLLEGKATGVEGAYDVGPPAVRKLLVPDVRLIGPGAAEEIAEIFQDLRNLDFMPPAPDRDARVHPLRVRLDNAVLRGIGFRAGEAAALAGELYESYARWRAVVEDVEMKMRENRRVMNASGQARSARPTDLAARRVWEEVEHKLKAFPVDFLTAVDGIRTHALPRNVGMPDQAPLFDAGIVHLGGGKQVDLGSHDRVRYAAMLSQIGFEPPFDIPVDSVKAGAIVDAFIAEHAKLRRLAKKHAQGYVKNSDSVRTVVEAVERMWLKGMRLRGMRPRINLDASAN